jgi:hypothetical protein
MLIELWTLLVIVYMTSGGELLLISYILNVGDDHLTNEIVVNMFMLCCLLNM